MEDSFLLPDDTDSDNDDMDDRSASSASLSAHEVFCDSDGAEAEHDTHNNYLTEFSSTNLNEDKPLSLEGTLYCRKGRDSTRPAYLMWRKRFVYLNFLDGGSVTLYKEVPELHGNGASIVNSSVCCSSADEAVDRSDANKRGKTTLQTVYTKLHRRWTSSTNMSSITSRSKVDIHIPAHASWVVKDVGNDTSSFVIEIPYNTARSSLHAIASCDDSDTTSSSPNSSQTIPAKDDGAGDVDLKKIRTNRARRHSISNDDSLDAKSYHNNFDESWAKLMSSSQGKGKPLRFHFRCNSGSHEKALWLKGFSRLKRLSLEVRQRKKTFWGSLALTGAPKTLVRVRNEQHESFANDARQLDLVDDQEGLALSVSQFPLNDVEHLVRGDTTESMKDKEYKVQPTYAYPHRWMTRQEMTEEMILPSETFHDLRVSDSKQKEIGSFRVEVLQCLCLPKLDRTSDTDAIVYMVCGAYAFTTDVIVNRANPIWLRKSRRACEFPIFHAYARLYVGVFDDDKNRVKDEFAGRIVVDLARLRSRSTYDVTIPLRLSTHVYTRRRRGAIRLRFTLNWHAERDALLSYLPKKINIPLPQNSKPRLDVTVMCADQKAFRNIAVTVHGAHLPGKFTFQQMRATIREMNFTRKYIFTAIRQWVQATRKWEVPAMSCFVFLSWMHCIYANSFALVPAYIVSYFCLFLMQNYAKYGIDGPNQRGFTPPSWEELLMALLKGRDCTHHAIEPMELCHRPAAHYRRSAYACDVPSKFDYTVKSHEPWGKPLFRALGFLKSGKGELVSSEDSHLEFPFAEGTLYPKFTVKECLVGRKGDNLPKPGKTNKSSGIGTRVPSRGQVILQMTSTGNGEIRMMPRFKLDVVDIQELMRKDSSGLNTFDEEEDNFAATRAVVHSGKMAVSKTAATISKTATGITERTGLCHVVNPITKNITNGVSQVTNGMSQVMDEVTGFTARRYITTESEMPLQGEFLENGSFTANFETDDFFDDHDGDRDTTNVCCDALPIVEQSVAALWQDQNVDVEGPTTGKKLTDDLADIKDKMHDMTWHCFDDKLYTIKNPEAVYFGQAGKSEKQRQKLSVEKGIEKLMKVGAYSHNNPFVARVGLYVEPIIGSILSILCLFRTGFNVMTWRDPILTFWLSFFCALLAIILFFFPWRLFLFGLGIFLVGPQNWCIRVLREKGHLPPLRQGGNQKKCDEESESELGLPSGQPVFTYHHRQPGNTLPKRTDTVDSREVHHVVVPYSPLMYQRFYDWPPEPQYAQVTNNALRRPVNNQRSHLTRSKVDVKQYRVNFQKGRNRSHSADSIRSRLTATSSTYYDDLHLKDC